MEPDTPPRSVFSTNSVGDKDAVPRWIDPINEDAKKLGITNLKQLTLERTKLKFKFTFFYFEILNNFGIYIKINFRYSSKKTTKFFQSASRIRKMYKKPKGSRK